MTAADGPVPIAHLITRLDVGGAQETALRTCALIDPARYRPVLLAGPDTGSGGSLAPAAREAGVEVHLVPELVAPIRPGADWRARRAVAGVLASRGIALLHTHSSKAGAIGRLAARPAGVRGVVHTVHGWSFHHGQSAPVVRGYQLVERYLATRTDALVVVTGRDRDLGLAAGIGRPEQYHLVRSGIALADRATTAERAAARAEIASPDDRVVITVGRLEEQKDPLLLVDAFAAARRDDPRLRLVVVGDGSLRGATEARIAELGIGAHVVLLGVRHDVPALLAAADLFVLSSGWEGLPRAVVEALHHGLPVVTTDAGGVAEVVRPGENGFVTPVGDAPALADAIRRAAGRDWPGLDDSAADVLPFDEKVMATRSMDVYDAVLRR